MRTALSRVGCVLSLLIAGSALAAPLVATETGDYSGGFSSPTAVGTLDVGVNTISGSVEGEYQLPFLPTDPADYFSVILPGGLSITTLDLAVSAFVDFAAESSQVSLASPSSGSATFDADGTVSINPFTISGSPIEFGVIPGIDIIPLGFPYPYEYSADGFSYTLSITVVPEPGTGLLVVAGLLGLVGWRRRSAE